MRVLSAISLAAALAALAAAPFTAAGCESAIPRIHESPAFQGRPTDELIRLARGREEYIAKCASCHALYVPARGDFAYWSHWMDEMTERSKLQPAEKDRIQEYLLTAGRR